MTVRFNDGSTKTVTDYTVENFDSSKEGECVVTIRWIAADGLHLTAELSLTVTDPSVKVSGIRIESLPDKLKYEKRESLDLTGLVVVATYTDGTEQTVSDYKTSGYNALKESVQTVTVTYKGFTATFTVTVGDAVPVEPDTTEAPTTEAPTTEAPTTEAPTTEAPTTEAPTTEAPTTEAPTTDPVPAKALESSDPEKAVVNADKKQVTVLPGRTADELKDLLGGGVTITDSEGKEIASGAKVGTGAVVKTADGAEYTVIVPGDMDGDGSVKAVDARAALRAASRIEPLSGAFEAAADISGDAKVKASDARSILRIAAKLDSSSLKKVPDAA